MEKREDIEEGFGVVLSEEFPGVVIDNQKKFTKQGIGKQVNFINITSLYPGNTLTPKPWVGKLF